MNRYPNLTLKLIAASTALALATCADAADVRFSVSAREAYVNQPFVLQIVVENAEHFQRPEFPKIAGAAANPTPTEGTSTVTEIINGRTSTRKTVTLTYRIVPFQPGTITIPPMTVTADGQQFTSQPIEIIVTQSETGDLMFAEVLADRLTIYLGESLRVRLRLWIKPYSDRQTGVRLNADQMWSLIDPNATAWGDFAPPLAQRRSPFGSVNVTGEEVIRTDDDGNRGAYFQYDIETNIWPTQTGPIQLQPPTVVVNYPVRIARERDFFSRESFRVVDFRPISVNVEPPPVDVVSPPGEGQPQTFNGAVGNYSVSISAKPTEVAVGDPITLSIMVVDHGDSQSAAERLNLLPPPPLERVDELVENFRMPGDPLAGTVSGNTKTFTQTIRAKSENVTRIPPIPISFFDPSTDSYVTNESGPIVITVKSGSQIGVNDIVSAPSTATALSRTELTAVSGGILANYAADEALVTRDRFHVNGVWIAVLIAPPLLFFGIALTRTSARYRAKNATAIRRRGAGARAIARIKEARSEDARSQAHAVLAAFGEYFADRLNLPPRAFTSAEIASLLRERTTHAEVTSETQQLLEECEQLGYASASDQPHDDLPHRALAVVRQLERVRLK